MNIYKYPENLNEDVSDYVVFEHFSYRVNDELGGRTKGQEFDKGSRRSYMSGDHRKKSKNAPRNGNKIILYMPNSTPGVENIQGWEGATFKGPKGQMMKRFIDDQAEFAGIGTGGIKNKYGPPGQQNENIGGAAAQIYLEFIAKMAGADANAALQLGKGVVYNPNVELLYKQPKLRKFTFDFNFIPKSKADTRAVDAIIREFKYWSAPGIEQRNFMTIPDLWLVTYYNASKKTFKRMNPWRPAALEGVITLDNPLSDLHSTVVDETGDTPVHTSLKLSFAETDIITRQDHEEADAMGYKRGY